jgi:hypothetical protein
MYYLLHQSIEVTLHGILRSNIIYTTFSHISLKKSNEINGMFFFAKKVKCAVYLSRLKSFSSVRKSQLQPISAILFQQNNVNQQ